MPTPRQLHALPSDRGSGFVASPRRGRRRLLVLVALLAVAAVGWRAADDPTPEDAPATPTATAPQVTAAEAPDDPVAPPVPLMAQVDGLALRVPSTSALLVGYHEASRPGALGLDPIGEGLSNANTTRITLPPDREDGAGYHVMSSRGRVLPPTSAVDVVMPDDRPVLAPVSGTVTEVRPYRLYEQYPDTRVEIRPDAAPDLRVVLIHVDGVAVEEGDVVTAGVSVLAATANRFPFASHVDRYLDERWPHVHLEVKDPALTE